MSARPPWSYSLVELAAAYRRGELCPAEVLASCQRRAARVAAVGAFVLLDPTARAQAEAAGAELRAGCDRGPLHGVPVAVKDLIDVAGQVTTAGSHLTAGAPPATTDAAVVTRLRAAGAVVFGRTRTHELAWGVTSRHPTLPSVCNPWDSSRVAGGSSGGSAAAVACGVVPVGVGTDTG
ncbi:MAG: amidase family protein, partial [Mycobacteriales bacterium]